MSDPLEKPAPEGFKKVTEGKATILFPDTNEVFYNPIQEFNRDISIAAIRTWDELNREEIKAKEDAKRARKESAIAAKKAKKEAVELASTETTAATTTTTSATAAPTTTEPAEAPMEIEPAQETTAQGITILEALSASGLRSIRYAREIPNVRHILTNDLEADAVASIRRNAEFNDIPESLLTPNKGDAIDVLYMHRQPEKRYDVIDLDPYGTASPFIDGAVQAVSDGGLLCVTCTDLAVLAGSNYTETCFSKYGGLPLKAEFCHEMALRLVLQTLQTSAARYKRYIKPLVSLSIDYYLRVFVRVFTSPAEVKRSASKISMAYSCSGCHTYYTNPLGKITQSAKGNIKFGVNIAPPIQEHCDFCGSKFHVGGPMWGKELHDKDFIQRMLNHVRPESAKSLYKTHTRILGMLTVCKEELDVPFYHTVSSLSSTLHCTSPSLTQLNSAILHKGYKVSGSHACQGSIKTDAPPGVIWDIMRSWIKLNPVKNIKEGAPAAKILAVEVKEGEEASFEMHPEARSESRKGGYVRYQVNPEKNWGPQARAGNNKRKGDFKHDKNLKAKTEQTEQAEQTEQT
ncbi:tRNA methyltransferase 1 [Actinomortierella ambigua]|uniref:tRNA (guanine(26)-N(2))-dimethyltransferase n=1 Tax=Actinomortierella ambigua TaxID=1343610 RepID=A0A9P6TX21_9FUNG|nr:tRNA methyltransferase 1 [Actinomortierella ambigua]